MREPQLSSKKLKVVASPWPPVSKSSIVTVTSDGSKSWMPTLFAPGNRPST